LCDENLSLALLRWYDCNARDLPWRIGPRERAAGARPDAYAVWLSEVMLQQTTVAAVHGRFRRFIARWPDVVSLARADDGDVMGEWAGLGYYARARNLLKCARCVVADHHASFPTTSKALSSLPGIGPYTAAAIAAIAFDQPATVVDGNVERVVARLYAVQVPLPAAKPELSRLAARLTPGRRPGCHAQAMMDLGATICTPASPKCGLCPVGDACQARVLGLTAELPHKTPKTARPTRHGIAYLAQRADGAWLLERRPPKGLLGGMLGWPGSDWNEAPTDAPPLDANWRDPGADVRHTFTHFHLRLALRVANVPLDTAPGCGRFIAPDRFDPGELPTVMRKALVIARSALNRG